MSAKQEAQRIFERFYNETLSHLSDHITREDAIQSALICIDEMIKDCVRFNQLFGQHHIEAYIKTNDRRNELEEIKQELKNLRQ